MKSRLILLGLSLAVSSISVAQVAEGSLGYYSDALLFGQTNSLYGSTARIQSIGGAQVSLGGDLSLAGSNPAGLGFFNKNVVSFTPSINFNNSIANFLGSGVSTYKNNFNFANMGVGINSNKGNYTSEKFKGGTFAITLSRVNSFNNQVTYQGNNTNNSIIDSYLENAGTSFTDQLDNLTYSAYENYLIDPVYDGNGDLVGYDSQVVGNPRQSETIETSGGQYQWNFSWGGNYDDKVYFGGGLGIVSVDYTTRRKYRETGFLASDSLNYLQFQDKLSVQGTGINATIGMIVRPVDVVTLGASYTTPTYYALTDNSKFTTSTNWSNSLGDIAYASDVFISDYSLRTPAKLSVGATAFLGKVGFLTGDVEFIDFSSSQLKSTDFELFADNQSILNLYTSTINYRLGAEFRLDQFRFRGGYAYQDDPYKGNGYDASKRSITYGVGYRTKDYYVDLGFVTSEGNYLYTPYSLQNGQAPIADIKNTSTTANVTIGFNF